MITQIYRGKSPQRTLNYIKNKKESSLVDKNVIFCDSREFQMVIKENPRVTNPVNHIILSPNYADQVDAEKWKKICRRYLEEMGYTNHQYIAYRHEDTKHDHLHILVSRIDLTTHKALSTKNNYLKSLKVRQKLEEEFNLTPTTATKQEQLTPKEQRMKRKKGYQEKIKRKNLRSAIEQAGEQATTEKEFIQGLNQAGVTFEKNIKGITYSQDGYHYSASTLGKKYEKEGLKYNFGLTIHTPEKNQNQRTGETLENLLKQIKKDSVTIYYEDNTHEIKYQNQELTLKNNNKIIFQGQKIRGIWKTEVNLLTEAERETLEKEIPAVLRKIEKQNLEGRKKRRKKQRQNELQY
jgi:uncharacterized protein YeaO (DUF488 family)